jgi:superfamily II DNA helicase RecQ
VVEEVAAPPRKRRARTKTTSPAVAKEQAPLDEAEAALFEKLREWRLGEARRRRVPAFRILGDRTLAAICRARPVDEDELLDVAGIGPAKASSYGRKILVVVNAGAVADDGADV